MSRRVQTEQIVRLISDAYETPKGSIGTIDQDFGDETVAIAWLADHAGGGGLTTFPFHVEDLETLGYARIDVTDAVNEGRDAALLEVERRIDGVLRKLRRGDDT